MAAGRVLVNQDGGAGDVIGVIILGDPSRTHGQIRGGTVVNTAVVNAAAADTAEPTRFDNSTDTWTVTTADGQRLTGRVLVDTTPGDAVAADDVVAAVAVHGLPNRFRIPGPHTARQARYVAGLIAALQRSGSTRIEARSRVRVHRLLPTRRLSRFYLSGSVTEDDTYDGPAELTHDGRAHPARVRLTGHVDPIDGQYHWQGTLYTDLPGERVTGSRVNIRVGEHTAEARISERTPWGTLSVVGAGGYPPFPLADVELGLSPRI